MQPHAGSILTRYSCSEQRFRSRCGPFCAVSYFPQDKCPPTRSTHVGTPLPSEAAASFQRCAWNQCRVFQRYPRRGYSPHVRRQGALCIYLGNRYVVFIYLFILRVLIVFTGSGKTTPGMLCAKYLDGGKSTIWFLPRSSMHEQYEGRFKEQNVTCETWSYETSSESPPLHILATIETTDASIFHNHVVILVTFGRLG